MIVQANKLSCYSYAQHKLHPSHPRKTDYTYMITIGKQYTVHGILKTGRRFLYYLIEYDSGRFDFLPEKLFLSIEDSIPESWIENKMIIYNEKDKLLSYPELSCDRGKVQDLLTLEFDALEWFKSFLENKIN